MTIRQHLRANSLRTASILGVVALLGFFAVGCAGHRAMEPLRLAKETALEAEREKADLLARPDYEAARNEIAASERAIYNYEYRWAERHANRAQAYGELAIAKTHVQQSNAAVVEAEKDLHLLAELIGKKPGDPVLAELEDMIRNARTPVDPVATAGASIPAPIPSVNSSTSK